MLRTIALLALALSFAPSATAHFTFILPDDEGATAQLILGEKLKPDEDVKIDLLAGAKLSLLSADGSDSPLETTRQGHSMLMALPGSGTRVVHGTIDLGVNQRGGGKPHLLAYYPKTIVGDAFGPKTTLGRTVPVELVPARDESGIKLKLIQSGSAAPDAEVTVIQPDGSQAVLKTDADGYTRAFDQPGRYGAWARYVIDKPGEREGKPYEQVRNYATLVVDVTDLAASATTRSVAATDTPAPTSMPTASRFGTLPEPVASFGAVASDGWLYVYGGHTAERHAYSTEAVSKRFHRLNLKAPDAWEKLPPGPGIQGMNLAAHGGKIYRVGGMEPRNKPGDPEDNHSIDDVARFDPATGKWEALPPLPEPRSSHDVAVVGDNLYVIGGWWMKGKGVESHWLDTMAVLDLGATALKWETFAQPFQRRALIVTPLEDKIVVVGGFDADGKPLMNVELYDAASDTWTSGPQIPGGSRNGFAPAACTQDRRAFLSVGSGDLFRLSRDFKLWEPVARTTPRIVHRMTPFGSGILVLGGAGGSKMLDLIEIVRVP